MNRSIRHTFLAATAACGLWLAPATAQTTATTDPVGAMTHEINAGSDNYFSVPLRKKIEASLPVSNVIDEGGDSWRIQFDEGQGWTEDQFANNYFLRIGSGVLDGYFFSITGNDSRSIIVDSLGENLAPLSAGDSIKIVQYWTLNELFPPSSQTALEKSTGTAGFQRGSEILLPNLSGDGINRAPSEKFFVTASAWYDASTLQPAGGTVLYPDSYFIIRQRQSAGERDFTLVGAVSDVVEVAYLHRLSVRNDNYRSQSRPVARRLSELGLGDSFQDSGGTAGFQREDELLTYDGTTGINPAPNRKFFRVSGAWYDASTLLPADNYLLPPGAPVIIRKAPGTPATLAWKSTPIN